MSLNRRIVRGNAELERISISLNQAHSPEEIFGILTGNQAEMLEATKRISGRWQKRFILIL
jgi:hypothetical protein